VFLVQTRDYNWHFFSTETPEEMRSCVEILSKYVVIAKVKRKNSDKVDLTPENPNLPKKADFDPNLPEVLSCSFMF